MTRLHLLALSHMPRNQSKSLSAAPKEQPTFVSNSHRKGGRLRRRQKSEHLGSRWKPKQQLGVAREIGTSDERAASLPALNYEASEFKAMCAARAPSEEHDHRDSLANGRRASASGHIPELQYGAMAKHEGYLRQDTRPVPFVSVKVRRYVRLEGTRLSLAKAPDAEVIWSFDIAGAHVQAYDEDQKISVWLTDSMRSRRRIIVLCAMDSKQYVRWSFWLRRASKSVLEMHYGMTRLINKGAFARVVLAKDLHTGRECAIKLIEKSNAPPSARRYFEREVQIMRLVSHPHIVKCLDIFDTRLRTRIVMEYMEGGMLSEAITRRGSGLPEHVARPILRGILQGVEYLHCNGIVHRDLKPDNCLLPRMEEPYGDVKLSDFGLSNFVPTGAPYNGRLCSEEAVLTSAVGSPGFVAPELFESTYGTAVDLWSVGVIFYNMLSGGAMPFPGRTDSEVLRMARKGNVNFSIDAIRNISRPARNLILGMLTVSVDQRLTASQALDHPWFNIASKPVVVNDEGRRRSNETGDEDEISAVT